MLQKEREKILLILLVPALIWACYYRKVHKPRQREVKRLRASAISLQREIFNTEEGISNIDLEAKKLRYVQSRCEKLEKEIAAYQQNFLSKKEIPSLIRLLAGDTGKGFELICMKADDPQKGDFYNALPIRISFVSDYIGLLKYLRRLESLSPLIEVSDIRLSSDGASINTHLIVRTILSEASSSGAKLPEAVSIKPIPGEIYDPFISTAAKDSSAEVGKSPALRLQGIIWGEGKLKTAIINGEVLKVGQKIDNMELIEIHRDKILLREGDKETSLLLRDLDSGK